jgi:hypothetical protein
VWSPYYASEKPLIFVPLEQFEKLLKDINGGFPSYMVRMPSDAEGTLIFAFDYTDHKWLKPHFVGKSSSKNDYERLIKLAPHFGPPSTGDAEVDDIALFEQDMAAALNACKNKGRAKQAKQEARAIKQQTITCQVERTQRSLHLLPPSPASPDADLIYIAVDVESFERNHSLITEIGFATLDTRDLVDTRPGEHGKDWHKFIRARHFRINEYKHLSNFQFVRGCPDNFEFGESEFINLKDAPRVVATCFKPPFSADPSSAAEEEDDEKRNIVFVGHDTKQDVNYLRDLGYDPSNLSNLIDFQDTATMFCATTGEKNTRGLSHIMFRLELEAWNTHNAGNDAVYTMQAMLGICIEDAAKKSGVRDEDGEEEGGVGLIDEAGKKEGGDGGVVEVTQKLVDWQM